MTIGLIRHYKVKKTFPNKFRINYVELKQWFAEYDDAEIVCDPSLIERKQWDICYSSPAKRALDTAQKVYNKVPVVVESLQELTVLTLLPKNHKWPFLIWGMIIRKKSLSKNKQTRVLQHKVKEFVNMIVSNEETNILIVSHGFVMMYLQKELRTRGFIGRGFRYPKNGKVYIYQASKA